VIYVGAGGSLESAVGGNHAAPAQHAFMALFFSPNPPHLRLSGRVRVAASPAARLVAAEEQPPIGHVLPTAVPSTPVFRSPLSGRAATDPARTPAAPAAGATAARREATRALRPGGGQPDPAGHHQVLATRPAGGLSRVVTLQLSAFMFVSGDLSWFDVRSLAENKHETAYQRTLLAARS